MARVDALALPRKMRSVAITGIFVLAIFYTLYFTAEIAIPLVFALLFKLLLQPGVRLLSRIKVPQPLGALTMIVLLFALLGGGGYLLAGPATAWLERAPQSLPRLEQHLRVFKRPIQQVQEATKQVEQLTQSPGDKAAVAVKGPGLVELSVLQHAPPDVGARDHRADAVLPAVLGRALHAPAGRDPAELPRQEARRRDVARGRGEHLGLSRSPSAS